MLIYHLSIKNFRGIRALDWHLNGRVLCLIGPNDSTKTTILDAIELVLLPRYSTTITDADFYNGDPTIPIVIEATVGDLPLELIVEPEKFGLCLRGYDKTKGILEDPVDGVERVLTVRFEIGKDLEPAWTVVKQGMPVPKHIGWQDRERLGVSRLGNDVERHLTWARGSALTKLTAKNTTAAQTFAKVTREAKKIVATSKMEELNAAAAAAKTSATLFGAGFDDLKPGLDLTGFSLGTSVLGLHEDAVPVRLWGLGTKRLAALAIQQSGVGQNSILLVDELELGLEPHRIRLLLERLGMPNGSDRKEGQVIFTTHSPTPVMALPVDQLRFVRSVDGETRVEKVLPECANNLQGVTRTQAHAFLGRRLVVCEGATELGLCRGLANIWAKAHEGRHPSLVGCVLVDGKGRTVAPGVALELKRVGYHAAFLGDSDAPLKPTAAELTAKGVMVFQWKGNVSTEERIAADLPLDDLQKFVDAAIGEFGVTTVLNHVSYFGNVDLSAAGESITAWIKPEFPIEAVRAAIGKSASKGRFKEREGWFKNVTMGTELGKIVAGTIHNITDSPLATQLSQVAEWIYA